VVRSRTGIPRWGYLERTRVGAECVGPGSDVGPPVVKVPRRRRSPRSCRLGPTARFPLAGHQHLSPARGAQPYRMANFRLAGSWFPGPKVGRPCRGVAADVRTPVRVRWPRTKCMPPRVARAARTFGGPLVPGGIDRRARSGVSSQEKPAPATRGPPPNTSGRRTPRTGASSSERRWFVFFALGWPVPAGCGLEDGPAAWATFGDHRDFLHPGFDPCRSPPPVFAPASLSLIALGRGIPGVWHQRARRIAPAGELPGGKRRTKAEQPRPPR